jgi:putative salt-induced outer membrane protein
MRVSLLSVVLFAAGSAAMAFADQIVLNNGDRLTGTIVKFDGKVLSMKTAALGEINVDWSAVQQITSDQQLHIDASGGRTLHGVVTMKDGTTEVVMRHAITTVVPKENIAGIRNDAEQKAYEHSLSPGLWQNWDGGATVSFALTRGNSETRNLALAFNADRKTMHDKLSVYANSVRSNNDAPGAVPKTTADTNQGGIRYEHDISARFFAFVGADFQSDSLQTLDLRSILGGGLGFHAIRSEATTLDLLAGFNYTHEGYSAFSRNFAAATLGEEFTHKLHGTTSLTQSLYFYPNLSNTGEYRTSFNLGTVTKISKWFGWQNSFGDIYVSNPPLGKRKNDLIFTTGLNLALLHGGAK